MFISEEISAEGLKTDSQICRRPPSLLAGVEDNIELNWSLKKKHWTKQKQKTNSRNKVLVNPKVQNQIKTGFKLELCSPHNNTYRTLFFKTTFYVLFSRNRIIPLTRILFHLSTKTKSVSTTLILLSYQIQLPVFSFDHSLFAAMLYICQVVFSSCKL